MSPAEAVHIVEGRDEGRRRHWPDARHALQPPHTRVGHGERRDPFVRVADLLVDLAHDGEQRGHLAAGRGVARPGRGG